MPRAPKRVSTVATGSINGSVNAAARATAARKTTPTRAKIRDLRLRYARKPASASVPSTVNATRMGILALPRAETALVAKSPGVSSIIRCATATSTDGTSG
jgi:hypothetical protein